MKINGLIQALMEKVDAFVDEKAGVISTQRILIRSQAASREACRQTLAEIATGSIESMADNVKRCRRKGDVRNRSGVE
jgi:hypothetical protein